MDARLAESFLGLLVMLGNCSLSPSSSPTSSFGDPEIHVSDPEEGGHTDHYYIKLQTGLSHPIRGKLYIYFLHFQDLNLSLALYYICTMNTEP